MTNYKILTLIVVAWCATTTVNAQNQAGIYRVSGGTQFTVPFDGVLMKQNQFLRYTYAYRRLPEAEALLGECESVTDTLSFKMRRFVVKHKDLIDSLESVSEAEFEAVNQVVRNKSEVINRLRDLSTEQNLYIARQKYQIRVLKWGLYLGVPAAFATGLVLTSVL